MAKASLVESASDPAAMRALLRDSVTNGGLRFEDPSCAAKFGVGEVRADQLDAFARCLSGLGLRASTRMDALGDVAVMTYGPGYEVEARVVEARDGKRLTWIGFASRPDTNDDRPTLTTEAFDRLRVSGERTAVLGPDVVDAIAKESGGAALDVEITWLRVCLDETGAVSEVDGLETTSFVAQEAFTSLAKTWTFKPFVVEGQGVPVCSLVRMAHPAERVDAVETLPLPPPPWRDRRKLVMLSQHAFSKRLESNRLAGSKLIVPDDRTKMRIHQSGAEVLRSRFQVCVDERGAIESVLPLMSTGFPAYDETLIRSIGQWRFAPYTRGDTPVAVCTQLMFIYSQR